MSVYTYKSVWLDSQSRVIVPRVHVTDPSIGSELMSVTATYSTAGLLVARSTLYDPTILPTLSEPNSNCSIAARLIFRDANGKEWKYYIISPEGTIFLSSSRTVNPAMIPDLIAQITAGGVVNKNGIPIVAFQGGYRVSLPLRPVEP